MAEKAIRRQANVVITYQKKRYNIAVSHAAWRLFGEWTSARVVDLFVRFSVAHGGPSDMLAAWEYWAQIENCGRGSAAMEAAIWWSNATAPPPQKAGDTRHSLLDEALRLSLRMEESGDTEASVIGRNLFYLVEKAMFAEIDKVIPLGVPVSNSDTVA